MKRLHVHVAVNDLAQSIRFYSTLFGAEPTLAKPDYAKWMLEETRYGEGGALDKLKRASEAGAQVCCEPPPLATASEAAAKVSCCG